MSEQKSLENTADLFSEQEIAVAFYCWMDFYLNTRPVFQILGVSENIANLIREIVNTDSSLEFRIQREIFGLDPNEEIRKLGMYWFTRFFPVYRKSVHLEEFYFCNIGYSILSSLAAKISGTRDITSKQAEKIADIVQHLTVEQLFEAKTVSKNAI